MFACARFGSCLLCLWMAAPPPGLAAAQDEAVLSLLDVYRMAQTQDPAFASARAAQHAAAERLPQARGVLFPSLNLKADRTRTESDTRYDEPPTTSLPGERGYYSNGYTVSLTQPLLNLQSLPFYQAAKLQVEQSQLQLRLAEQDLILRVSQAYFEVLLAQDNVALAGAQKTAIKEQLDQAKRSFEVGTVTITDTHEAQSRFDLAHAQEIAAVNELEIKKQALAKIIGRAPERLLPVSAQPAQVSISPDELQSWMQRAEQNNLGLKVQQLAEQIAGHEVRRQRAGHLPTVDIVGSYSHIDAGPGSSIISNVGSDTETKAIGLQLQMPLFQGGAQQSRVREALANRDRVGADLELARRDTVLGARQAFLGVTNGLAQIQALEQALSSSQLSLDSNRRGFEVGVRTGIDVLNAQQQLYNAKRDLSQARYQYLLNRLRLEAAVADLTEQDLIPIAASPAQAP